MSQRLNAAARTAGPTEPAKVRTDRCNLWLLLLAAVGFFADTGRDIRAGTGIRRIHRDTDGQWAYRPALAPEAGNSR